MRIFLLRELLTCGTVCLPSYVVNSRSVNSFKNKTNIDKCWRDVYYNYKCDT